MMKYDISFSNIKNVMMEITNSIEHSKIDSIEFDLQNVLIDMKFIKFFNFCIHLIQSKYVNNITYIIKDIEENAIITMLDLIKFSGVLNKFIFVCVDKLIIANHIKKCYNPDINIKGINNDTTF